MKLNTQHGQLTLPRDLTFEVHRTNPFLNEEGDATYPTEIPASSANLRVMGQPNRIDDSRKPLLKQPAILTVGAFQLRGTLIMSASDRETITTALAIDNGDLWTNYRDMKLQKIVGDDALISFDNMQSLLKHVNAVSEPEMYRFPVAAVARNINEKGVAYYGMNNEPDLGSPSNATKPHSIVWEERLMTEKGSTVCVPEGYGIAPQLLLHKALDAIFEAMGYTLEENFFSTSPWNRILLLNNTSDAACKLRFKLSEMLPTCTLAELVSFLQNKFHCQVVADSAAKTARIVRMEDVLSEGNTPDLDISKMLDGRWAFEYHNEARVVLSDDLSLEDATAAKETVAALEEKYSSCQPVDEADFALLADNNLENDPYFDCLIQRLATGDYYRLVHHINSGAQRIERLGTNAMTYDRKNADEAEEFAASDRFAPMIDLGNGILAPYIGERNHLNTHLTTDTDTDADNTEQPIIVAWYIGVQSDSDGLLTYRMASPQHYDAKGNAVTGIGTDLTPLGLYGDFWKRYNKIIRNGRMEVEGHVCYPQALLQAVDMTRTKIFCGQRLLPESMSYALGNKTVCGLSRFVTLKEYPGTTDDSTDLFPLPANTYKWVWNKDAIDEFIEENSFNRTENYIEELQTVTYEFSDGATGTVWLDQPTAAGLIAHRLIRYVTFHIIYIKEDLQNGQILDRQEWDVTKRIETWFDSVES